MLMGGQSQALQGILQVIPVLHDQHLLQKISTGIAFQSTAVKRCQRSRDIIYIFLQKTSCQITSLNRGGGFVQCSVMGSLSVSFNNWPFCREPIKRASSAFESELCHDVSRKGCRVSQDSTQSLGEITPNLCQRLQRSPATIQPA